MFIYLPKSTHTRPYNSPVVLFGGCRHICLFRNISPDLFLRQSSKMKNHHFVQMESNLEIGWMFRKSTNGIRSPQKLPPNAKKMQKCNKKNATPNSRNQPEAILKVALHSIKSSRSRFVFLPQSGTVRKVSCLSKICFLENLRIPSVISRRSGGFVFIPLSGTDRADAKLCVAGANNPHHQTMPAYH